MITLKVCQSLPPVVYSNTTAAVVLGVLFVDRSVFLDLKKKKVFFHAFLLLTCPAGGTMPMQHLR